MLHNINREMQEMSWVDMFLLSEISSVYDKGN